MLDTIKSPVRDELEIFERRFRESMKSPVPLLDKITWYIVKNKGKQVRPILVLLSARMFGPIGEATYIGASMIELLHTASLVHDDVVDDANERRGFFSVNALWKNKIAVLVGDYLLSQGLLISLKNNQYQLLQIVSEAVKALSEGELLQMEKARKLNIDEEVYFQIIKQKTASLVAAACSIGAASVTNAAEHIEAMRIFGEKAGIAFQIRDDLFDYGDDEVGKPIGIDIKEKKMTLPLIYALSKMDAAERKKWLKTVKNDSENPEIVKTIIQKVRESGGIEYAREAMYRYREEARQILLSMPPSESRNSLNSLLDFVTERKK